MFKKSEYIHEYQNIKIQQYINLKQQYDTKAALIIHPFMEGNAGHQKSSSSSSLCENAAMLKEQIKLVSVKTKHTFLYYLSLETK